MAWKRESSAVDLSPLHRFNSLLGNGGTLPLLGRKAGSPSKVCDCDCFPHLLLFSAFPHYFLEFS